MEMRQRSVASHLFFLLSDKSHFLICIRCVCVVCVGVCSSTRRVNMISLSVNGLSIFASIFCSRRVSGSTFAYSRQKKYDLSSNMKAIESRGESVVEERRLRRLTTYSTDSNCCFVIVREVNRMRILSQRECEWEICDVRERYIGFHSLKSS